MSFNREYTEALDRLIAPCAIEDFIDSIWESRHLHVVREQKGERHRNLDDLISIDDIDELLTGTYAAGQRRWDSVRLGKDGELLPPDQFLSNRNSSFAQVDVERVLAHYRHGASIILNNIQEAHASVARLCNDVSRFFGVPVHANAYLTPPHAQGFPLHFDSHDVFLLQVAGEKHWNIYDAIILLANATHQRDTYDAPAAPPTRLHLKRGDVLYLPRGLLHEGLTTSEMSLHLTIGVHPYTWSDLLHDIVSALAQKDVDFRRSVAPSLVFVDEFHDRLERSLLALSARLADTSHARRVADRRLQEVRALRRGDHHGALSQAVRSRPVAAETVVQLVRGLDPVIQEMGERMTVSFASKTLVLPRVVGAQVAALCSGAPSCAAQLPPTLDEDGRLVLVQRLVHEGLLEVLRPTE
ncbi:cupin domain-containing protein [Pseudonocardia asaccharolytica]|uniref:JmjC domain-containing protein n=1 Tax=Pseudonocardia asaccharolytica DSM 44247 = NBRC 16224 TaxID=1123024 RepID=A0A511DB58_9PSEU|nr:cupin domain-containing protein [Pseudonocardia asaccharolytica]GEL20894.1 hypothetical protein PA7_47310 [Pseudonocardia asaccharolytica DSM 44247 = NBRC 16224]